MVLTAAQRQLAAAMSEDSGPESLEAHVRAWMDTYHLWGWHPRISIGSKRGWPDWSIFGPGGVLFRELKSQRGDLSIDQRAVGSRMTRAGLDWAVWRPVDLLDGTIERQLRRIA